MREDYEEFYALHLDEFVKVIADFRCERCGRRPANTYWFKHLPLKFRGPYSIRGRGGFLSEVKLTVHHRDGNPRNNRLSNLACLCRRCHLSAERLNRKFKQTSLLRWFSVNRS